MMFESFITNYDFILPSLANPSAHPQVSTLTNCNSTERTGTEHLSRTKNPEKGFSMLHLVESRRPFNRKSGAPEAPVAKDDGVIVKGTDFGESFCTGLNCTRNCWLF